MSTKIALEKYLPDLAGKAEKIEYYIGKAENVDRPSNLERLKDELKSYLS